MKGLCILGATGSIGISTLEVVALQADHYQIIALTAHTNTEVLLSQCIEHHPQYVVVVDKVKAIEFERLLQTNNIDTKVLQGVAALEQVATLEAVDTVMAAIVGAAGLLPSLAAAKAGKIVLLANKEALVMSGNIFMHAIAQSGAQLLPIDSEHNAIFQCMPSGYQAGKKAKQVRRILLTASGGPFRTLPIEQLTNVTPAQAIAHPNWDMGKKISVDSATMMNKGLEMIEACLLFDMASKDIQIVLHPQSIIHSMVDYVDGTVLAQMGNPDMRIPIAHAMATPDRFDSGAQPLNIFDIKQLDFAEPDLNRFPCLGLAYQAIDAGGIMPTVLNAANEIAVDAFLRRQVKFTDIFMIIERCMARFDADAATSLEIILAVDQKARDISKKISQEITH